MFPTLEEHVDALYRAVLAHTRGNKIQTAAILGVSLRTIYRWIHDHDWKLDASTAEVA